MNSINTQFNRGDRSIQNVLRMLKPVLIGKEIIGKTIKAAELAKICRNHHRRLPVRNYRALDLAEDIDQILRGGGSFVFDDLVITVYHDIDPVTRRRSPGIDFQYARSLEQQCENEVREQALEDLM